MSINYHQSQCLTKLAPLNVLHGTTFLLFGILFMHRCLIAMTTQKPQKCAHTSIKIINFIRNELHL